MSMNLSSQHWLMAIRKYNTNLWWVCGDIFDKIDVHKTLERDLAVILCNDRISSWGQFPRAPVQEFAADILWWTRRRLKKALPWRAKSELERVMTMMNRIREDRMMTMPLHSFWDFLLVILNGKVTFKISICLNLQRWKEKGKLISHNFVETISAA